jgi:hypothetical protein
MILIITWELVPDADHDLILNHSLELLLGPDHDLKTCSAILSCRPFSKSHKIYFGATSNLSFPTLDSHFFSG